MRGAAALAPPWHTAALVALIVAVAITGTVLANHGATLAADPARSSRIAALYLPIILVQCALAFYVCRVGRARSALAVLLGERWSSVRRAAVDLALAAIGWGLIMTFEIATSPFSGATSASTASLLPHTVEQRLAWVIVSMAVGVCEEIVYRGYLQSQLGAFARSAVAGVVLQAILFGVAHAEQGLAAVGRSMIYGLAFGALARWRRSLLPGIVCHVGTDLASGLLHP